jgi:predicted nucleotidyltransferase
MAARAGEYPPQGILSFARSLLLQEGANYSAKGAYLNRFCIFDRMTQLEFIKSLLGKLKPELVEKYAISTIGLFGSIVRDDFSLSTSDIDIIVDFSRPVGIEFIDLADYLEQQMKRKVDLVSRKGIKQKYFQAIESDIIYV